MRRTTAAPSTRVSCPTEKKSLRASRESVGERGETLRQARRSRLAVGGVPRRRPAPHLDQRLHARRRDGIARQHSHLRSHAKLRIRLCPGIATVTRRRSSGYGGDASAARRAEEGVERRLGEPRGGHHHAPQWPIRQAQCVFLQPRTSLQA